jgi:signal peptide peptidase SppA
MGEWCVEPTRFAKLWAAVQAIDISAHLASGPPPKQPSLTEMVPAKSGKNIAVLKATGTLMKGQSSFGGATSTVQFARELRTAVSDPTVSGILLAFDSPGGTVAGTDTLAGMVRRARKAKAVWAFADDLTASAAYWIASQAGAFYAASPTTLVGSIGTVLTVYDQSAAAEAQGVKTLVFATGPVKGAGTPGAPITEEQSAYFQSVVNGIQQHFDAAVRSGRQMTAAQLSAVRSGGVWPASEAVGLKLVDGIKSLEATVEALANAG